MNYSRRNGFTLIEVLIAMTLLGIMVVLLFSSLRIAAESWDAGENKIAAVNKKAVVYQFFKRHLTTIRPLPALADEKNSELENAQPAFQGLAQGLQFVAALPASSARKGLQLFNIHLDPTKPSRLIVRLTPYRQTEATQADEPVVLLENITNLKFAYFGKTEDVADLNWREEWTVADRLPSLIKVTIALEDGSYWPDMVFALKITEAPLTENAITDEPSTEPPNVDNP